MIRSFSAILMLGIGWSLLVMSVLQSPGHSVQAVILGSLLLSECLSVLISAAAKRKPIQTKNALNDAIGRALLGWVMLCIAIVAALQFELLLLFVGYPFAGLCVLALTLVLTLLRLIGLGNPSGETLLCLRLIAAFGAIQATRALGVFNVDVALAAIIFCYLILLLIISRKQRHQHYLGNVPRTAAPSLSLFLKQYADLLILPFVLSGPMAVIYFVARGLSLIVTFALSFLTAQAEPAIAKRHKSHEHSEFVAMAARLNLGCLLIGGSISLAILTIAPYLADALPQDKAAFQSIVIWVLLGAGTPIFFGATNVIFRACGFEKILACFNVAAIMIVWLAVVATPQPTPVFIAQCFAITHLTIGAVSAVFLAGHSGVWPGLTALVLRQIKLF